MWHVLCPPSVSHTQTHTYCSLNCSMVLCLVGEQLQCGELSFFPFVCYWHDCFQEVQHIMCVCAQKGGQPLICEDDKSGHQPCCCNYQEEQWAGAEHHFIPHYCYKSMWIKCSFRMTPHNCILYILFCSCCLDKISVLKGQFDPPENVILMGKIEIWSVFWISPQIRDGNTRIVCCCFADCWLSVSINHSLCTAIAASHC